MITTHNRAMHAQASYDWRLLARTIKDRIRHDNRGYRALAAEIGITATDLSRAASAQVISAPKVIALCDWMNVSFRVFYIPPNKDEAFSNCCSASHVKPWEGGA